MNQNMYMNMMNAMNKMGKMNQTNTPIFDPDRIKQQEKNYLANQTVGQSRAGQYELFSKWRHVTFPFVKNYQVPDPLGICEVVVVSDHLLDVAEQYAERGNEYKTPNNNMNPVVLNVVGCEFSGSNLERNEEIRDELINIRTTFNNTFLKTCPFPLKKEECTYLKFVTVIRPKFPMNNTFLPFAQTFPVAMITTCPIKITEYLSGNTVMNGKMKATDFIDTLTIIECVFQLAIWRQHPILILPPFGHDKHDANPVDDIISVYNYCIYKYGHMFKKIIIAVPKYTLKEILVKYQKGIIKPNEMVVEIDKAYEKEEIKKQVLNSQKKPKKTVTITEVDESYDEQNNNNNNNNNNTNNNNMNGITKEQMEMFMKMMPMMAMMNAQN